jgi:virulence-associated protein VagC
MASHALHSGTAHTTLEVSEESGTQVVRLPEGFKLAGNLVSVRRVENGILLEPIRAKKRPTREELAAMWAEMDSYGADPLFPNGRDQGTFDVRDEIK